MLLSLLHYPGSPFQVLTQGNDENGTDDDFRNSVPFTFRFFELSGGLCLIALKLKFGPVGNGQESGHDTGIDRGHKVVLRGPESFVPVKLRRSGNLQGRKTRHGKTSL